MAFSPEVASLLTPFLGRSAGRLATSGERVNHDSWVKMCNLCRGLKTSILAELTVRSGLGDSCCDDNDSYVLNMLIIYYLMLYIIYVTLIMRL